jgi:hypothetical protein
MLASSSLADRIGTSMDFYADNVGVYIIAPVVNISKKLSDHWGFITSLRVDAITSASMRNGSGTGYNSVQSDALSSASGRAGFDDLRVAPTLGMVYENDSSELSFGRYMSNEVDYDVNSNYIDYKQGFDADNTVLTFGYSSSYEGWNPTIPYDLEVSTKEVEKFTFSLTQLMSPKSYFQIRYSVDSNEGLLSSPYHFIETTSEILPESYPTVRNGTAYALMYVQQFGEEVSIHTTYRKASDDWEMQSETFEGKLFYNIFERVLLGIKGRYYTQTAAYFVKPLDEYSSTDQYIVSDYRLSALGTLTAGFSVSYKPESLEDNNFLLNVAFNYYQTDKNNYIENWYGTPQIQAFYMSVGIGYDY